MGGDRINLEGKTAIVTGAGRGIGAATARELARHGARVVVNDIGVSVEGRPEDESVAAGTVKEIEGAGGEAIAVVADAATSDGADRTIEAALDTWGRLDILVNNAGTLRIQPLWDMTEDDWDEVLNSHARHAFATTSRACRHWKGRYESGDRAGGRIVNMVAATGLLGRHDMGANHAAAKGAMAAFTLVAAHEMFPYGVTVNAVSPAAVRTRMATHVNASLPEPVDGFDRADPENVAPLVTYLCSEDASWITGQVIRLVGGTVGWFQPWTVVSTMNKDERWTTDDYVLGMRKLMGVYPGSTRT